MEQNKEELLKQQQDYYSNTFVLFEILRELKNREFALLNSKIEEHLATRFLYASNLKYLKMHLDNLGVTKGKKLINLYRSNAHIKPNSIPVSSYNLKIRTTEQAYKDFNMNFLSYIDGFDFIIDIDGKTIEESYEIAKEIKGLFDDYKTPYYLKNSGTRGFHFIIPHPYSNPNNLEIEELIKTIRQILYNLAGIYKFQDFIDLTTTNPKGLIKCSYSFDIGNISLPLTDLQFQNFDPELVKIENVMRHIQIMNRGLLLRNHKLSEEKLKENVSKFYQDFL